MIDIPYEIGECNLCMMLPVCKLVEKKNNVKRELEKIENINNANTPFRIKLECNYFQNRKGNFYRHEID